MPPFVDSQRRWARLTQTFLTGVVAALPLALTAAVLLWVVRFVHDLAGPDSLCGTVFKSVGMSVVACDLTAYVIGLISALLLVFLLGFMIENGSAKQLGNKVDEAIHRVPVVGTVYDATKQLTSMFDRKQDSGQSMTPVLCYFGDDRNAMTPALMPTPELVRLDGKDYHVVIIPTAPVPFGGALLCVKADWVQPAACSFEELVGVYMSMGVTAPKSLSDKGREASVLPATGNPS